VKVTRRNFGRDRRYPITNRFRDLGAPVPEPDRGLAPPTIAGGSERFVE
jgi:NAD+ synthase